MTIYDELQGVATELLTEFKQGTITYIQITPGNGPIDDPGPPVPSSFIMVGGTVSGPAFKYISQGLALTSDKQIVAPVDPRYTPDKAGFIDMDGGRYKILQADAKPANGTPTVYVILARKNS